jgi:hypothetical protein
MAEWEFAFSDGESGVVQRFGDIGFFEIGVPGQDL